MRILLWHVHGSWTTSFVQGGHTYLLPTLPDGGPWGRGRAGRDWPDTVHEIPVARLAQSDVDVVVLQRPEELELTRTWLGRTPGLDVPAVYVEHNTPRGDVPDTRHPLGDRGDITLVHVTHANRLLWDNGRAPTTVIEHGIVDPGYRYTGELARAAVVTNEPVRRWRITGTDLYPAFAAAAPLDVFGMGLDGLAARTGLAPDRLTTLGDLDTQSLHTEMSRRRVYLHTTRWTSLGLSLLEAMHLGMPVVALATTEAPRAVPPDAGVVTADVDAAADAVRRLVADPALATETGKRAREAALENYDLSTFSRSWDALLTSTANEKGGRRP
jgi:hypothetical protein